MKTKTLIAVVFLLALLPVNSYAQMDERKPGIYAVVGEESIPLPYSYSGGGSASVGVLGVNIGHDVYKFDGVTSGVNASDTFVLVIDPKKRTGIISKKKFDIFCKDMTPDNIIIVPFTINQKKSRREYDLGTTVGIAHARINTSTPERYEFEWEQISDNSFKIKVSGLTPGEYGIVFRVSKLGQYQHQAIHGFTIPEPEQQTISNE